MTDKQHESLSALLDNEASELDCHRLAGLADEALKSKLNRYALMSQILHTSTTDKLAQLDVSAAVANEIRSDASDKMEEDNVADSLSSSARDDEWRVSKYWSWERGAVAASLMFVFMGAFILWQPDEKHSQGEVIVESSLDRASKSESLNVMNDVGRYEFAIRNDASDLSDLVPDMLANAETDVQLEKLNEYLLRHAGNGFIGTPQGVAPYARLASFSVVTRE